MHRLSLERTTQILDAARDVRILVVGDIRLWSHLSESQT
jgi:hypothetical protein